MKNNIAWCAGLFDGDGSVSIIKKQDCYVLQVSLSLTHLEALKIFHGFIKCGNIYKSQRKEQNRKPFYVWKLTGFRQVVPLLEKISSYLICKKNDVETILELYCKIKAVSYNDSIKSDFYEEAILKLKYFRSKEYLRFLFNNKNKISFVGTKRKNIHTKYGTRSLNCNTCGKSIKCGINLLYKRKFCSIKCSAKNRETLSKDLLKIILDEYKPYCKARSALALSKKYNIPYDTLLRNIKKKDSSQLPIEKNNAEKECHKLDADSISWAAGLFDAEGCISIGRTQSKKDGKIKYNISLSLQMTHVNAVVKFAEIVGLGSIRFFEDKRKDSYKDIAQWSCQSFESIKMFLNIFKIFLVIKKFEADVMVDFINKCDANLDKPYSEVLLIKDEYYKKLKHLKSLDFYNQLANVK